MVNEDASLLFTLFCALPQSGNRKSSSLKNEVFLHIFTQLPNPCLWSFLPAGVWIVFLFTALHTPTGVLHNPQDCFMLLCAWHARGVQDTKCFINPPFQTCHGVVRKGEDGWSSSRLHFISPWQATLFRYEAFAFRKYEAQASEDACIIWKFSLQQKNCLPMAE